MRRSYFTCSYVVTTGQGIVLVDAGLQSSGRDMVDAVSAIGRDMREVRAVLLTHWHNDHAAGAAAIHDQTGAAVYYHAREAPYFTRQTAAKGLRGILADVVPETGLLVLLKGLLGSAPARGVAATRLIRDGDIVEDDFEVIETPGHTPGHVCFLYRPKQVLFAGDALAVIGGRLRFMSRPVTPDVVTARASMLRCLARPVDFVCPGHRQPLQSGARDECRRMHDHVAAGGRWPLFG